jgi:hypothetical protein
MSRTLNPTDSWVVVGPGRTGSQVIASVIQDAYKEQGLALTRANPQDPLRAIQPASIHHSHDAGILDYITDTTNVVISTRDVHATACSRIIMDLVGKVHFNQYLPMDMSRYNFLAASQEQWHVDPDHYRQVVKDITRVYKLLVDLPHTYIDYREFVNDTRVIRNRLDLPAQGPNARPFLATIPTPKTHREWITNYAELEELSKIICPFKPWTSIPTMWEARS